MIELGDNKKLIKSKKEKLKLRKKILPSFY